MAIYKVYISFACFFSRVKRFNSLLFSSRINLDAKVSIILSYNQGIYISMNKYKKQRISSFMTEVPVL